MKPSVYIVNGDYAYEQMFIRNGWVLADDPEDADLIQFTGGEDVDPMLYFEPPHPTTHSNPYRDSKEAAIYNMFEGEIPYAGICRGAQFLCVMNGGRMWQDVDNHAVGGGHMLFDHETEESVLVSSTHHQMMDPSPVTNHLVLASASRTSMKSDGWGNNIEQDKDEIGRDVEAVWFPETNTLCYQPHPEFFDENHECQELYFRYIKDYIGLSA